jgi:Ran GTPase-activating protein 1
MGGLFSTDSHESEQKFLIGITGKRFDTAEEIHEGSTHLLEHAGTVVEVILSQNSYGPDACKAISDSLAKCSNLRVANLSDIFVGRLREEMIQSMTYLSSSLLNCSNLEVLNVRDNAFGPDGVRAFRILLETSPNLKELNVTNDGLGPEGARLIAEALSLNPNLKLEVFEAGRSRLENEGTVQLAQVFGKMRTLRKISIPQNGIKKEGMVALFRNLLNNPDLQMIEVNDNYLNDLEAASCLSACIESLSFLSVLNIGDCMLGDKGAGLVLNALKSTNQHLMELYVQYNELSTGKTVDDLIELAMIRDNLVKLHIQGNDFKKSSKEVIKNNLKKRETEIEVKFYSSGEEEFDEDDDEEDLSAQVEKLNIKDD